MRTGWSDKDAAVAIQVNPRKVSQALGPALLKVRRLWRIDPTATLELILADLNDLDPMSPEELELRTRMLEGRADRTELHPRR